MYEDAFGPTSVLYNGYLYGIKEEEIYLKRIIYIPESTNATKEDYINAAKKRINDYLGNDEVKATYGVLISSLPSDSQDPNQVVVSDENYYNITVKGKTYKFYIIKGSLSDLAYPTYSGKDLNNNIVVSTSVSSVPLGTNVN